MARAGVWPVLMIAAAAALQGCSGAGASGSPPSSGATAPAATAAKGAPSKASGKSGVFGFLRSHKKVESLASGAEVTLRARDTISSRTNKAGDAVVATAVRPVVAADGDTVIPAGAVFEGTITDIAESPNPRSQGRLAISFATVRYGGQSYPIQARMVSAETEDKGRGITGGTALKVGGGAAIGGIAGRIIGGNGTGTLIGAAAGAAAGGVYAHETRHLDVVLPAGNTLRATLSAPFQPQIP